MNVRRFTARTSRDALVLVREALGNDAVVLSTKPCTGGVEVLAMAPDSLAQIEQLAARTPAGAAPVPAPALGRERERKREAAPSDLAARSAQRGDARAALPARAPTPVEDDIAQLSMSTLSFQDYVRERMLKRRQAAINGEVSETAGATASAMASATSAPAPAPARAAVAPDRASVLEQRMSERQPAPLTTRAAAFTAPPQTRPAPFASSSFGPLAPASAALRQPTRVASFAASPPRASVASAAAYAAAHAPALPHESAHDDWLAEPASSAPAAWASAPRREAPPVLHDSIQIDLREPARLDTRSAARAFVPQAVPAMAPAAAPAAAAAYAPYSPAGQARVRHDQDDMLNELRQVRGLIEERFGALAFMEKLQRQPKQALLTQRLLDCGFSPALIRKIGDSLPGDEADEINWAAGVLTRNLITAQDDAPLEDQGGVYALVGATGVGKTTTTAKIAAAFATKYGASNLGLITLDAYRIGAHEQLRAYGRILGVPVHTAHDRASLEDMLDLLAGKKMVLIDTAGMAQRDARTRELLDMLSHRAIKKLLVVNAASQGETIEDVMLAYRASSCAGVVLSKLDEAVKLAPALDALIRNKLKLVGVANGQRVPEDWHRLSAAALVQRALRSAGSSAYRLDSSDVSLIFSAPISHPATPASHALQAVNAQRAALHA